MARRINQLSARQVATLNKPGLHGDGNGLYLRVTPEATRSWIFRFMINGRARAMGLGPVALVSLADARDAVLDLRRRIRKGVDPLESQRAERERIRLEAASAQTFKDCAEAFIASHRAGWSNAKHAEQWVSTLSAYVYPEIGDLPVQQVCTAAILRILEPIWSLKPETAKRVQGRIENVMDWATARKLRAGDNPARWRGNLEMLLPALSKSRRVQHHPALRYADIAAFMTRLREQRGVSALALEFTILTAARTGEVVGARWSEIDFEQGHWTIPGERMKAGKLHRVPLSRKAISILRDLEKLKQNEFVFPGLKAGKSLSRMSMLQLLKRMSRTDVTTHGFRSTFRDWAAEKTDYSNELVEMSLAHAINNRVEAAYRRGDMLERRLKLMEDWTIFCGSSLSLADSYKQPVTGVLDGVSDRFVS